MLSFLITLNPNLKELHESPILDFNGNEIAWHCTVITGDEGFSGGFHKDKMMARKIAIAEFIERSAVLDFFKNQNKEWCFDKIPTGCGFAAGFDMNNTIIRSLYEAAERWSLSKLVDDGFSFEKCKPEIKSKSSLFFSKAFSSIDFYSQKVFIKINETQIIQTHVGLVLAYLDGGVFMGSRASANIDDVWEHSLLEAYRHLLIVKNKKESSDFPFNRIFYFSKNKNDAIEQVKAANKKKFPIATVAFQRIAPISYDNNIFIARTILNGGKPWHLGPESRFLY